MDTGKTIDKVKVGEVLVLDAIDIIYPHHQSQCLKQNVSRRI